VQNIHLSLVMKYSENSFLFLLEILKASEVILGNIADEKYRKQGC
ncbi:MAG: hypothetical protein ACI8Z7_000118, partial [Candidatus Nanohaloarchaea archaeon]